MILTRRSVALPLHAGEVALPGGRVERGESMVDAALREAHEEVGIVRDEVQVLGWLDRVTGRTSGSVATPVVGVLRQRPALTPQPSEVEEVFDVALSDLLSAYREERWDTPVSGDHGVQSRPRAMHFFELGGHTVWGMTARVLHQLLVEVTARTRPPPPEPPRGREGRTPPEPA